MSSSGTEPTQEVEPVLDPLVGTIVGDRYRIMARLGEGGMGAVYQVEHTLMKKVMALKLLHHELGEVEDAARRFEREAQSASRLSHPNIIQVTDFGRSAKGELFLVMEFVAGQTLGDVLEAVGRFPPDRAVNLAAQILLALEHAHSQGVIHRDLKPANVMLVPNPVPGQPEQVKILDFGIAKLTQTTGTEEQLTKGVMVFGTPSYMSPEQATGEEADNRTDLYSCGIMLYEMLTGKKPFQSDDLVKLLRMQVTAAPPKFAEVAPDLHLSSELESAVMRALAKERNQRYASAADFREAILRAHADMGALGAQLATTSLRLGLAAGARLLTKLPLIWRGIRFLGAVTWRGKLALDRLANPLLRRLPRLLQPAAIPALLVGLCVILIVVLPAPKGASPKLEPPKPKPVAPELRSPIKQIEEAMGKGHFGEARVHIMQQISAHPDLGRVRYLLGNLEFADKNPGAGLEAYEEALRLDPGLRADGALLVNVRSLLQDKRYGASALQLMTQQIGKPACEYLVELASEDKRIEIRQPARDAVVTIGCPKPFDKVTSYALDLSQGRSCEEKRIAVENLGKSGDPRAIEPLRKARQVRGGLFSGLLGSSSNACIVKDIDRALTELGVPPDVPAKKKRRR